MMLCFRLEQPIYDRGTMELRFHIFLRFTSYARLHDHLFNDCSCYIAMLV